MRLVGRGGPPPPLLRRSAQDDTKGRGFRQRLLSGRRTEQAQVGGCLALGPACPHQRNRLPQVVLHGRAVARRLPPSHRYIPGESMRNDSNRPTHVKHFGKIRATLLRRSSGGRRIRDIDPQTARRRRTVRGHDR